MPTLEAHYDLMQRRDAADKAARQATDKKPEINALMRFDQAQQVRAKFNTLKYNRGIFGNPKEMKEEQNDTALRAKL